MGLRCGGICIDHFIARLYLSPTAKEFWKSVIAWWSYGYRVLWLKGVNFFVRNRFFFKFSIWCCSVHVSSLLMYSNYNCNMGGRHRWLLLFRQPITNMHSSEVWCVCLFVINKFFFFFFFQQQQVPIGYFQRYFPVLVFSTADAR